MTSKISLQQFKGLFLVKGIFALLLAAPGVASAAAAIDIKDTNYPIPSSAYFVSPDGKDTNSGKTPDSPWSVAKAVVSAPSGSTIVFKGGTYRNVSAKINKTLTLQAYPHEKPWLKGSIEVEGWVADGAIWRKNGWNYSFPINVSSQYIDPNYPMARYGDMVYINGVSLKQVASKAAVVTGTFYVDAANQQLYIGDNPAGKTVEATALKDGLIINSLNTVARGLGFSHYADSGIKVQGQNATVENNTSVWNGVQGIGFTAADAIVRGNSVSYNGRKGMGGYLAHRMLLENNNISYNNVEHFSHVWDAAGIKAVTSDNLIWRNNVVENNFATGMWFDVSSTNATVVHNTIRNNEDMGIMFELSHKAIIAANVVYNNLIGIMIADSSSAHVYNNTLSMHLKNLVIKDSTRENTNATESAAGATWITRDNVVKNNILSNATTIKNPLFEASDCVTKKQSNLMITAANNNAYYRTSSSQPESVIKWSFGSGKCSVGYTSIAAFNSETGFETNAHFIDNVETNPFFVDEANGDYHLKSGSPAIGRGEPLPADIAKAIGLAAGVPVDLGALQSKTVAVQ